MKRALKCLTISLVLGLSATAFEASARSGRDPELDAMNDNELIHSVETGKQANLVREFQIKEATRLYNGDYNPKTTGANVETYRNKEVIIITIPTDRLFAPNETSLKPEAEALLKPLSRYMKPATEDMYRLLMVMHTDNTGSEAYTDQLSLDRAVAVFDWFEDNGYDTDYVFMRARGASEPNASSGNISDILKANDTYEKRYANRRLEIFLIPGERMIDEAKKGRIAF